MWSVIEGDCLDVMRGMEANSVDAVVTDPPYGLSFMGKDWDHGLPGVPFWEAAISVAKPGAHLLAFGGTRTFHRLACAIEDAGWEIRDCVMWVYGSGFPKSHDVSKAIDKAAGAEREVVGYNGCVNVYAERGPFGDSMAGEEYGKSPITAPATDAARQWAGWGTALKPAWEPIIVARKPLEGTVAANVMKWGTGAINVDGGRVGYEGQPSHVHFDGARRGTGESCFGNSTMLVPPHPAGRWPANLVHDGSDQVLALFPDNRPGFGGFRRDTVQPDTPIRYGVAAGSILPAQPGYGDTGSAARFFYCAKASKRDRDEGCEGLEERRCQISMNKDYVGSDGALRTQNKPSRNHHPTVKPTDLMRYLCRLVTPPGGLILDPFAGSGSTGKAAMLEGFKFVGIEQDAEYAEIARRRIGHADSVSGDISVLMEAR